MWVISRVLQKNTDFTPDSINRKQFLARIESGQRVGAARGPRPNPAGGAKVQAGNLGIAFVVLSCLVGGENPHPFAPRRGVFRMILKRGGHGGGYASSKHSAWRSCDPNVKVTC